MADVGSILSTKALRQLDTSFHLMSRNACPVLMLSVCVWVCSSCSPSPSIPPPGAHPHAISATPAPCFKPSALPPAACRYRPPVPILTLVVPHLVSDGLSWKLEGRCAGGRPLQQTPQGPRGRGHKGPGLPIFDAPAIYPPVFSSCRVTIVLCAGSPKLILFGEVQRVFARHCLTRRGLFLSLLM